MPATIPQPPASPTALPPRPPRCVHASRAATICFWAILILFFAALVYIGLLAFSLGNESFPGISLPHGALLAGCILALCTIAAVIGSIATGNHRHHPHH